MKKFLTIASIFVFAVLLVACGAGTGNATTFDAPFYTINIPNDWDTLDLVAADDTLRITNPDDREKYFNIMVNKTAIPEKRLKEKFDEAWIEEEYKRQIKDNLAIDGLNCGVIEYEWFDLHYVMIYGVRDATEVTIRLCKMSIAEAKPIIDSIKWKSFK